MKDFKIIATEERKDFEEKLRKYMQEGYEVKNTNMTITLDTVQRMSNPKRDNLRIGFYAYMEKEQD